MHLPSLPIALLCAVWNVLTASSGENAYRPMAFQYLKGAYKQEGEWLFIWVGSDRTGGNGFKLRQGRFRLEIRRQFFTKRVVTH